MHRSLSSLSCRSFLSSAPFFALASVAASVLTVQTARAECATNNECEHGFSCEVVGSSGCAAPACAPNSDCTAAPPCESVETKDCVPADCDVDADCADGMVCFESMVGVCSGGAAVAPCAPDAADCNSTPVPVMEPECTVETSKSCVPRYVLPCESAADCGDGFDCVEEMACGAGTGGTAMGGGTASGDSAGTGADAGVAADPAPAGFAAPEAPAPGDPPACEPSGLKVCQVIATECSTEADCAEGWECVAPSVPTCDGGSVDPAAPGAPEPGADGAPVADAAIALPPDCGVMMSMPAMCAPPFAAFTASSADDASGLGMGAGEAEVPAAPGDPMAGPTVDGAVPPSAEGASASDNAASCSAAVAAPSASGVWSLALGLAFAFGLRRRARAGSAV